MGSPPMSPLPPSVQELVKSYGLTLDNTIGFLLISFAVSTFLFGLLSFQVYHFYQANSEERLYAKLLVRKLLFHKFTPLISLQVGLVW